MLGLLLCTAGKKLCLNETKELIQFSIKEEKTLLEYPLMQQIQ